jgi:hypothetical protein
MYYKREQVLSKSGRPAESPENSYMKMKLYCVSFLKINMMSSRKNAQTLKGKKLFNYVVLVENTRFYNLHFA